MRPNLEFPADLVTFTEDILNGKLHFLCSVGTTLGYLDDNNFSLTELLNVTKTFQVY